MNETIKKYPMRTNTESPNFNYLVSSNDGMDYYLFYEFDYACRKNKGICFKDI